MEWNYRSKSIKFARTLNKNCVTISLVDGFFLFLPNTCLRCNFLQSKENIFSGLHFETTEITSNWPERSFLWPTAKPSTTSNYRSSSILNHFSSIRFYLFDKKKKTRHYSVHETILIIFNAEIRQWTGGL